MIHFREKFSHRILFVLLCLFSMVETHAEEQGKEVSKKFDRAAPNFILFRTRSVEQPYHPEIYIDNRSYGVINQGEAISLVLKEGIHRVAVKDSKMNGILGTKFTIKVDVTIEPNVELNMRLDTIMNGIFIPTGVNDGAMELTDFELLQVEKDALMSKDDATESRHLTMVKLRQ